MDPTERLKMLYLGDMQSKDIDTRLNPQAETKRGRPGNTPAPSIQAEQGVSGSVPEFDFDPVTPVSIPVNHQFHLSYIRTRVIGVEVEGDRYDRYLTEFDQDGSPTSCTLELSPKSNTPSDECRPDVSCEDVSGQFSDNGPPAVPKPTSFTPAVTMARFAINYCYGDLSKMVSERFYNGGEFWNRNWDLYVEL